MALLYLLATAACYLLFHWQFFRCVESAASLPPTGKTRLAWTFLLNYGVFYLCSVLGLHLIANWIIFLLLLFAEQRLLCGLPARQRALFSLLGTQLGLAVNILCRSLVAILLDTPLTAFDNRVDLPGNMKLYPVLLGFLAAGAVFWAAARCRLLGRMHLVLEDGRTLAFSLLLLAVMYGYLCMNLTVYSVAENSLTLKLWSMKSAVFVIVGQYLSAVLSVRLGQNAAYRAQSQASREALANERLRERELHSIACTDPLTGCENRRQAELRLEEALRAGRAFCLCFADLDGLKAVNDLFGHEAGDQYILAVCAALDRQRGTDGALYRYGGDEFLLLLFGLSPGECKERLRRAQRELAAAGPGLPFAMDISYGVAAPQDGGNARELIHAADRRMYRMKQEKPGRGTAQTEESKPGPAEAAGPETG